MAESILLCHRRRFNGFCGTLVLPIPRVWLLNHCLRRYNRQSALAPIKRQYVPLYGVPSHRHVLLASVKTSCHILGARMNRDGVVHRSSERYTWVVLLWLDFFIL